MFNWDAAGRLKSATADRRLIFTGNVEYGYDAFGRRTFTRSLPTVGTAKTFVNAYAGSNCIAEYKSGNNSTTLRVQYVYGVGIDSLAMVVTATKRLYAIRNQQWSVTALLDFDQPGTVVERYAYDKFGERTILAPNGTQVRKFSHFFNNFGYTSRRHEVETGLMYFRARYYDPATGEFISRDPLEYVDGMSLYRGYFVPGGVDPLGLQRGSGAVTPNDFTNPFVHHYKFGRGREFDLVRRGYLPKAKTYFARDIAAIKQTVIDASKAREVSCDSDDSFSDSGSESYNLAGLLHSHHFGVFGRGALKFEYSCSNQVDCTTCDCGEEIKTKLNINCTITISIADEFTNPQDINGVNARSAVVKKQQCYAQCGRKYPSPRRGARRGARAQKYSSCIRACDRKYIDTDIERFRSEWLGDITGNPYLLTGTWTEELTEQIDLEECN